MRESNFPRKSSYKGPRNRRAAEQLRKKKQRMILGGVGAAAAAALIAAIVFWPEKEEKKTEAVIAETESTEAPVRKSVAREGENGRETLTISNMAEPAIDGLLDEIFASQEGGTYILNIAGEEAAIEAEVAAVARAWDVKAQNTKLDHFDNNTGKYVFTEGKSGKLVDQEKLAADIEAVIASGNYRQTILQAIPREIPTSAWQQRH